MLKEILIALSDCNTNIVYANVKANQNKNLGVIEMGIEVDNITRLQRVISVLQALPEVHSVKRIQGASQSKHAYNLSPTPKTTKNSAKNTKTSSSVKKTQK